LRARSRIVQASSVPHAGIEARVQQVDHEVAERNRDGDDDRDVHQCVQVTVTDRLHGVRTKPGKVEHDLDELDETEPR
jgi:hypothetical protein